MGTFAMVSLDGFEFNRFEFWRQPTAGLKHFGEPFEGQAFHVEVCEGFFVLPADVPHDSSCEITVIETILDWAPEILRRRNCSIPL